MVLASTFAFENVAEEARAAANHTPHLYTRWSNPTQQSVEERIADLEGAERAWVTASGMAAVSLALLAATRRGGPALVQTPVYGGTHELCGDVLGRAPFGVAVRRAGVSEMVSAAADLPDQAAIYLEIPANPTNRVADLAAIRAAAPNALIVVDATFATPICFQPLSQGADLVVHSATKFLAGHHDVIAGVVAGSGPLMDEVWQLRKLLGPVLDPAAAYRLWRGLETLDLRVRRQCETATDLAAWLHEHPAVTRVHYPSLPTHPDHATAKRLLTGYGAVVSFEVHDAQSVADRLQHFEHAPSLGGVRSLVSWPAGVSHVGLSEADRAASGVPETLLRLALGVEPIAILRDDLDQALY